MMKNKKKAIATINLSPNTLSSSFRDALEKEEIKKKILQEQRRMQKMLSQAIKIGWEEMDEEERKTAINLGLLAQKLRKELKEAFKNNEN